MDLEEVKSRLDNIELYPECYNLLSDVYHMDSEEVKIAVKARYDMVESMFIKAFHTPPHFYTRAPGRVNLIGEHIDYSGYAVLPMALDSHDTVLAIAVTPKESYTETEKQKEWIGDVVSLVNVDGYRFPPLKFDASINTPPDRKNHHWSNYFKAAYIGVMEHIKEKIKCNKETGEMVNQTGCDELVDGISMINSGKHIMVCVDGRVPIGSGLSSSSALVCASALAVGHVSTPIPGILDSITKTEYAHLCCRCERYIGMESGGMDQAISFLSDIGAAKLIEFNPIRAWDVPLPSTGVFVLANSGVEANKYATADTGYNLRVVECRIAAVMLAHMLSLSDWQSVSQLKDIQDISGLTLLQLIDKTSTLLHDHPYSLQEVAEELGMEEEEVVSRYTGHSTKHILMSSKPPHLFLQSRAVHVFSEASRVYTFKDTCETLFKKGSDEALTLAKLGMLMNDSHVSCRDLFHCSCKELDEVVDACINAGAEGVRLTGAGWGGWCVALVNITSLPSFLVTMKATHFRGQSEALNLNNMMFVTGPGKGAAIINMSLS